MYRNNEEIEKAFLGAVLIDNAIIKKTRLIKDDFEGYKTKKLFILFCDIVLDWWQITPLTFKSFIDDYNLKKEIWYEIIFEIWEIYELSTSYLVYENKIKEYSKKNKIKQIKENITESTLWESIKLLSNLSEKKEKWNSIVDLADSFEQFREDFKKQWWLWYPWPYSLLNKYTWWIIPWKVYTIVAYSWVWKSNFSYSYVVNALKQGKKVICFSLEVQKEMLFNSLLKSYYNVNQSEILKDDFVYDLWDFENLIVYDNIYKLQELKDTTREDNPDIIFIDFIQNIQTEWNSEYEKLTKIAQELQQLAIETNTTIFNISQVNNDSRFKESGKIQPKWSGAIFASSDIIFALSRDWNNLQLNILKNKYWPSDKNFVIIPNFRNIQFKISIELINGQKENDDTDYDF